MFRLTTEMTRNIYTNTDKGILGAELTTFSATTSLGTVTVSVS